MRVGLILMAGGALLAATPLAGEPPAKPKEETALAPNSDELLLEVVRRHPEYFEYANKGKVPPTPKPQVQEGDALDAYYAGEARSEARNEIRSLEALVRIYSSYPRRYH